jgi:hypothetical protein
MLRDLLSVLILQKKGRMLHCFFIVSLVLYQVCQILSVSGSLLDLMKLLQILWHLHDPGENTYDILIILKQFQLLIVLKSIRLLQLVL